MKKIIPVVLVIAALIILGSSTYSVSEDEAILISQFGKVQYVEDKPGLHFKVPFIQATKSIYTANILYDIPTSDVITSDKKSMIADNYVTWYVSDPVKYYQTLNAVQGRADERIEAAVYNATKKTISSMTQDEIIASRGSALTKKITEESNSDISQYGITIGKAEIKALDLPEDNKNAVYERMISERNNIAAGYKAQGDADAQKIKNETDKQVTVTVAEAKKQADVLEGEGESEYMRILSEAYNDPAKASFYNFVRSLDSLDSLVGDDNVIILDQNSELGRILNGSLF
ncbi:MAG: protease modulator HflC [Pseudobutyrivibrio sp.]|nr:protease modulator HflC [Pseudobutyrivibrio sp.]